MEDILTDKASWGNLLVIAIGLLIFYFALQFLNKIVRRAAFLKVFQQPIKNVIRYLLQLYEMLAIVILGSVFVLINPFYHGVLFLIILSFKAYTKNIKERNRILSKLNEELNNEIAVRSKIEGELKNREQQLKISNRELKRSNEDLEQFAYIASHDLKEPLRNIGGFITLIKRRIEQKKYESLDEYIQFVEKSNLQMVELVETILQYSKMDFMPTETEHHTDIQKEIFNVCELLRDSFSQRNVQLFVDDIPNFHYNPFVVKTILKNLIENAIKYNKSESPIIRISSMNEGGKFNLIVSDNGIGIAPKHHQKVFEMFVRLNNREEYNGSGMGLAFCKKILMNNGGSISVESEEGKGSKFKVTLPVFEGKTELPSPFDAQLQ